MDSADAGTPGNDDEPAFRSPFDQAVALYQDMRYAEALPLFEQARDERFRRARCYYHTRDFEKAVALFEALVEQNPDGARLHAFLGDAYEQASRKEEVARYENAEAAYERAKVLGFDKPWLFFHLGQLQLTRGELASARLNLETFHEKRPDDIDGMELLGSLAYEEERWDAALAYFDQAVAAGGDSAWLFTYVGHLRRFHNQWREAEEAYRRVLLKKPDDAAAREGLRECRWHRLPRLVREPRQFCQNVVAQLRLALRENEFEQDVALQEFARTARERRVAWFGPRSISTGQ